MKPDAQTPTPRTDVTWEKSSWLFREYGTRDVIGYTTNPEYNPWALSRQLEVELTAERERGRRVREVLEGAVATINGWHNMDGSDEETWKIYYENAPEMKPIREMLNALSRAESAP